MTSLSLPCRGGCPGADYGRSFSPFPPPPLFPPCSSAPCCSSPWGSVGGGGRSKGNNNNNIEHSCRVTGKSNPIELQLLFHLRTIPCLPLSNSISHFDWFHISSFLLSPLLHFILILNVFERIKERKRMENWLRCGSFRLSRDLSIVSVPRAWAPPKCVLDNIIDYSRHPPTAAAAFFYIFFFFLLPPASTQVPPPSLPSRERGRRGWGRGETERGYLTLISGCRPAWILHQHRPEQVELEHFP